MKFRFTLISGLILLAANAPLLFPDIPEAWLSLLEYERHAIRQGEVWRIVTGHLVHWSAAHFWADASAFLLLLFFLEQDAESRKRAMVFLPISAVIISVLLFFLDLELAAYRGISGIVHGLFVLTAAEMIRQTAEQPAWRIIWIIVLAAGILKPVLEVITGAWLLPTESRGFFGGYMGDPTPLAHLGGVIALPFGLIFCMLGQKIKDRKASDP